MRFACRSREGAWIEIAITREQKTMCSSRSREGAWIEIRRNNVASKSQVTRRSREGAWIEISDVYPYDRVIIVAPARERGLKFSMFMLK